MTQVYLKFCATLVLLKAAGPMMFAAEAGRTVGPAAALLGDFLCPPVMFLRKLLIDLVWVSVLSAS